MLKHQVTMVVFYEIIQPSEFHRGIIAMIHSLYNRGSKFVLIEHITDCPIQK